MKNILLGVTGSVAAIKVLELANSLKSFANIKIILTQASEYFLQTDFPALKVLDVEWYRDSDEWPPISGAYPVGEPVLHIEMRRWADAFIVAPLDANTLAKIAVGLCDNLLTSAVRAWDWQKPMLLCPAMNTMMWENPPTAEQVQLLTQRGAIIIEPIEKKLACQDIGMGGMAAIETIVMQAKKNLRI